MIHRLKGTPASSGEAKGPAAVHQGSGKLKLQPGEILVTEITDPSMFVEILENAAGIVTDLGGITSHPAIIARELGIPCVVGVENATKTIPPNATILVNGEKGTVEIEGE